MMHSSIQKVIPLPLDTTYPFLLIRSGLLMNDQKKDAQNRENKYKHPSECLRNEVVCMELTRAFVLGCGGAS